MQGEQRAPIFENVKLFEYIALGQRSESNFFLKNWQFIKAIFKKCL